MDLAAARFDDLVAGSAWRFPPPQRIVQTAHADDVRDVVAEVDAATRTGLWACGFVSYEAAPGFDPNLPVNPRKENDPPLIWFALSGPPEPVDPVSEIGAGSYRLTTWELERTAAQHAEDISRIRAAIAAGRTYQVNLTTHLRALFDGDAERLYADLVLRQRPAFGAFIDTGSHAVLSASPELFFSWTGSRLTTRPMKGTAARGRTPAEDSYVREHLLHSPKERAENLIVVDLLRNDLGRIADVGTVRAETVGQLERYETVWQLTSTVTAEVVPHAALVDVFAALFPSGSITGAPKASTMGIVRDLEPDPRGIYCGTVGWVAPPGESMRARFNVAIRTVVIDTASRVARYGVGGGITWGSQPEQEWAELAAKARILSASYAHSDFELFETAAYLPGTGIRHLDAHLQRLAESAEFFGFPCAQSEVIRALNSVDGNTPLRVRMTLARDGQITVQTGPMPEAAQRPVTLALDTDPIETAGPWVFHKTTRREPYDSRRARHRTDDVVLVNDLGHVTETTIANLAVRLDGRWWTPPLSDGLLPGVHRRQLLLAGTLQQRSITVAEFEGAEGLAVLNSLRGWRDAVYARTQPAR